MTAHTDHKPDLGQPNGIATLDVTGKVPALQLPASGSHPVTIAVVDPTVSDDSDSGLAAGHHWINTTAVPARVFQAASVVVGAAVWKRLSNRNDNTASVPPAVSNDNTQGYEANSQWYDSVSQILYVCLSAATGAALWRNVGDQTSSSADPPGVVQFGSILIYPIAGGNGAQDIQYVRVQLIAGKTYDRMRVFIDNGGSATRDVRIGVYDQTDPLDASAAAAPVNRVAQTVITDTNVPNGTYLVINLTTTYTPTVSGLYWLALIQSSSAVKFNVTAATYRSGLLPVWRATGTGTNLPATAVGLTNPASAVIYVSLVEQGIVL